MKGEFCKITGCNNIIKDKGRICPKHGNRFWRFRDYNYISPERGKPHITSFGYMRININGKRVLQHRYIMEQHLGRKLKEKELIHHLNHIKTDNRIENLELISSHSKHFKKYHSDTWKYRKHNKPLSIELQNEIINIAQKSIRINKKHFCHVTSCNNISRARDLCHKHFFWYFKHVLHGNHFGTISFLLFVSLILIFISSGHGLPVFQAIRPLLFSPIFFLVSS